MARARRLLTALIQASGRRGAASRLAFERVERVAVLSVNRPERANALDLELVLEMSEAFDELEHDNVTRVVILTGTGARAFIGGADLVELLSLRDEAAKQYVRAGQEMTRQLEMLSKPVIAAINGAALGGGLEIALACDIRCAADTAVFGLPETSLGLLPGWGGTQRLPRVVGVGRAVELIMTARRFSAAEALDIGVVHEVVPLPALLARCQEIAMQIAKNSPRALEHAKKAINRGWASVDYGMEVEAEAWLELLARQDRLEGIKAALERRAAHFA